MTATTLQRPMNEAQLSQYLRITDPTVKAEYLVRIGCARDFADACSVMGQHRRTRQRVRELAAKQRQPDEQYIAKANARFAGDWEM